MRGELKYDKRGTIGVYVFAVLEDGSETEAVWVGDSDLNQIRRAISSGQACSTDWCGSDAVEHRLEVDPQGDGTVRILAYRKGVESPLWSVIA